MDVLKICILVLSVPPGLAVNGLALRSFLRTWRERSAFVNLLVTFACLNIGVLLLYVPAQAMPEFVHIKSNDAYYYSVTFLARPLCSLMSSLSNYTLAALGAERVLAMSGDSLNLKGLYAALVSFLLLGTLIFAAPLESERLAEISRWVQLSMTLLVPAFLLAAMAMVVCCKGRSSLKAPASSDHHAGGTAEDYFQKCPICCHLAEQEKQRREFRERLSRGLSLHNGSFLRLGCFALATYLVAPVAFFASMDLQQADLISGCLRYGFTLLVCLLERSFKMNSAIVIL